MAAWGLWLAIQAEGLGSDSLAERLRAESELRRMGPAAYESIRKVSRSEDPEARSRASALLEEPAFVRAALERGELDPLGGRSWHDAVLLLTKMDPDRARAALERASADEGLVGFRARQIRDLIAGAPRNGLVYGIVLDSPRFFQVEPFGVEIWINTSDRPMTLERREGMHRLAVLESEDTFPLRRQIRIRGG